MRSGTLFDVSTRNTKLAELEDRMSQGDFWNLPESQKIVNELKTLKAVVSPFNSIVRKMDDIEVLYELANEEHSDEALQEVAEEVSQVISMIERLELSTMLNDEHDAGNCYFSIHAGAGGTESCDWVQMLYRMYTRYFERTGLKAAEVDRLDGEEAGIRSVTFHVAGPYAYGYLSCERGVHRLVRISPFDSQKRRHTSFASVDVLPELQEVEVDIDWDEEVREDTFCSSGA